MALGSGSSIGDVRSSLVEGVDAVSVGTSERGSLVAPIGDDA